MDEINLNLISYLCETNFEFRKLYDEHQRIHSELEVLKKRKFLTEAEQFSEKELKVKKLRGRDRLLQILAETQSNNEHKFEPSQIGL